MTSRGGDPGVEPRDAAAAAAAGRALAALDTGALDRGPALILGDPTDRVAVSVRSLGMEAISWRRRLTSPWKAQPEPRSGRGSAGSGDDPDVVGAPVVSAWPPEVASSLIAVRMPRDKRELDLLAHLAADRLVRAGGGTLVVFGTNDEGIRSVARRLDPLFEGARSLGIGGRARAVAMRPRDGVRPRIVPESWRLEVELGLPELPGPWFSYPGVFAGDSLDGATRLLLAALPSLHPGSRVLDFGCGHGVVGGVVRARQPDLALDLLDTDALALEAAELNVPGGRIVLADGLAGVQGPYDLVASNPPYHVGKRESSASVDAFVTAASEALDAGGRLVFVTQRRFAVSRILEQRFRTVVASADSGPHRVWDASGPR